MIFFHINIWLNKTTTLEIKSFDAVFDTAFYAYRNYKHSVKVLSRKCHVQRQTSEVKGELAINKLIALRIWKNNFNLKTLKILKQMGKDSINVLWIIKTIYQTAF